MSGAQRNALPAVLKQYVASYEQKIPMNKNANDERPPPAKKSQPETKQPTGQSGSNTTATKQTNKPRPQQTVHPVPPQKRNKSPGRDSLTREKTIVDIAKQKQHARKTYDQWQTISRNLKEEDTELLKRKIQLQLQLIRQQQALADYNRQQEDEERKKKRDEERQQKREIAEALLRTCQESLEVDRRQKVRSRKPAQDKPNARSTSEERSQVAKKPDSNLARSKPSSQYGGAYTGLDSMSRDGVESDDDGTIPTAASPTKHHVAYEGMVAKEPTGLEDTPASTKPGSPVSREVSQVRDYAREYTAVSTLAEMREEEEEAGEQAEEEEFSDLPWHHVQLYKLYGRAKADSFLYPKIETEKKKTTKPLDPKFVSEGGGRLSANELWSILRGESQTKLLQEDEAIPKELKEAFGCFVRESISKNKQAVTGNFNRPDKQEELDISRMQDHSRVLGAQNSRHKLELMFRSSHMNEDRANVLQFNNPIPDLNNMQGQESVARYMPSWIDDGEDDETVMTYMKWIAGSLAQDAIKSIGAISLANQSLSSRKKKLQVITESGENSKEPAENAKVEVDIPTSAGAEMFTSAGQGRNDEWGFLFTGSRQRAKDSKEPKYVFLTEKKATVSGEFSKRRREAHEAKNRPKGYELGEGQETGVTSRKPASAMGMLESNGSFIESSTLSSRSAGGRTQSARGAEGQVLLWPPLSLSAVQEYTPDKQAPGQGKFREGKEPVWKTQRVVSAN